MRRIYWLAWAALSLGLVCLSCSGDKGASPRGADPRIRVTATIFPPFDFVREIAGDRVNAVMLLPPGAESHSWEPSPRDIITIQNSAVFIYVGGESDAWIRSMLGSMDTSGMRIIALMDTVDVVEEEIVEGMEDDEDDEDSLAEEGAREYDEHVWTSPENARRIVRAIAQVLVDADPANAGWYRENAETYLGKLTDLDTAFREVVDGAARRTIVFGDRFPFRYFAGAYGLNYYAAFPGCSTETEPSAATVAFLIDKIRSEGIPVVFHIELSNEKMADAISEATGAKKRLLHAGHSISKRDFEAGTRYLDLMAANVLTLREALY